MGTNAHDKNLLCSSYITSDEELPVSTLQDIYTEWQNNLAFRERFKKNPEQALKEAGFELAPEDIEKIKALLKLDKTGNDKLDDRISK